VETLGRVQGEWGGVVLAAPDFVVVPVASCFFLGVGLLGFFSRPDGSQSLDLSFHLRCPPTAHPSPSVAIVYVYAPRVNHQPTRDAKTKEKKQKTFCSAYHYLYRSTLDAFDAILTLPAALAAVRRHQASISAIHEFITVCVRRSYPYLISLLLSTPLQAL